MNSWRVEFGDAFAGQRVLVTGASGFVGGYLCAALLDLGAEVHALSRQSIGVSPHCKRYTIDLKDLDAVRGVLAQIRPQIVYHLASQVTARQEIELVLPMLSNNLIGTVHLLLALTEVNCQRVVMVGSSEEPVNNVPTSPYAASKAGARLYAGLFQQIYGLPLVAARLFMAYGPQQQPNRLIPYLVLSLLRGESPRLSSGVRLCDFVYVVDAVCGLLTMGLHQGVIGSTIDLGTGKGVSIREMAILAADLIDGTARPLFGAIADRTGERNEVANLPATQALVGWTPNVSLEDGLKRTIEFYQTAL